MLDVNEIREIVIDQSSLKNEIEEINELFQQGWGLIAVQQRGYLSDGDGFYASVYILGRKA